MCGIQAGRLEVGKVDGPFRDIYPARYREESNQAGKVAMLNILVE